MTTPTPLSISSSVKLRDTDVYMPVLALGTYQLLEDTCISAVKTALEAGYRHFDTARLYKNESRVGAAIHEVINDPSSKISRSDIFVTTKHFIRGDTPEDTCRIAAESVRSIGGDGDDAYVDLFLIHTPNIKGGTEGRKELWQVLERFLAEGKVRAIGVSNYGTEELEEMKAYAKVWPPHVNQIEVSDFDYGCVLAGRCAYLDSCTRGHRKERSWRTAERMALCCRRTAP